MKTPMNHSFASPWLLSLLCLCKTTHCACVRARVRVLARSFIKVYVTLNSGTRCSLFLCASPVCVGEALDVSCM